MRLKSQNDIPPMTEPHQVLWEHLVGSDCFIFLLVGLVRENLNQHKLELQL